MDSLDSLDSLDDILVVIAKAFVYNIPTLVRVCKKFHRALAYKTTCRLVVHTKHDPIHMRKVYTISARFEFYIDFGGSRAVLKTCDLYYDDGDLGYELQMIWETPETGWSRSNDVTNLRNLIHTTRRTHTREAVEYRHGVWMGYIKFPRAVQTVIDFTKVCV